VTVAKRSRDKPSESEPAPAADKPTPRDPLVQKHLAFGWWALAVFTLGGLVLEGAHGLKLGWYLDLTNATRRLSLTLGHAHGTLLGLVNIAFALSLPHATLSPSARARASFALRLATVLLPLGFVLGGFTFYGGDPGIAIVLVPPSAVILVIGVATFARGFGGQDRSAR
jgi:hypothetical protein